MLFEVFYYSSSFLIPCLDYCSVKMRIEARKEKSFCVFIDFQYFAASVLLNKIFFLLLKSFDPIFIFFVMFDFAYFYEIFSVEFF